MERLATDILIAGGGVAGLTAAAAFGSEGFSTICVDPVPPVTAAEAEGSDLRSTAFLMPAVRLLERAGLWPRLAPEAAALRIMRIADAGGPEPVIRDTVDFAASELGEDVFGYNLPNWLLRREMVARLSEMPGAELRAGVRLDRVTPRTAEVLAQLSDGTQVRARLLVAADGRDSTVREALGIGARRWGYGQKALDFTVFHPEPHDGVSTEIHRSGGPFTLVPLPDRDGRPQSAVVPCLLRIHHRRDGDETWPRPPNRSVKTAPSPSISTIKPLTSSCSAMAKHSLSSSWPSSSLWASSSTTNRPVTAAAL
jgi:2-octaprenyl-6-methoxyphenol hydroxylase